MCLSSLSAAAAGEQRRLVTQEQQDKQRQSEEIGCTTLVSLIPASLTHTSIPASLPARGREREEGEGEGSRGAGRERERGKKRRRKEGGNGEETRRNQREKEEKNHVLSLSNTLSAFLPSFPVVSPLIVSLAMPRDRASCDRRLALGCGCKDLEARCRVGWSKEEGGGSRVCVFEEERGRVHVLRHLFAVHVSLCMCMLCEQVCLLRTTCVSE